MKNLVTPAHVREIHLIYGVVLTLEEVAEETDLINARALWEGETKSAETITHQYAEQRAMLDFGL